MHTATNHFNGNNATPRDLRSDGPAAAGAGRTYPVDPVAVQRLKAHIDGKQTAAAPVQTAVPSVKRADPANVAAFPTKINPRRYSPEVIAAARAQENVDGRRDIASVLTDEVLAIWSNSGLTTKLIAKKSYNGLIEITQSQASRYLRNYRERLKAQTGTAVAQPIELVESPVAHTVTSEAAVAPPTLAPELPAEPEAAIAAAPETAVTAASTGPETAVVEEPVVEPFAVQKPENLPAWLDRDYAPPRPGPGDALAALAALVNNEQLRVRGSVKLNLEIEFGD